MSTILKSDIVSISVVFKESSALKSVSFTSYKDAVRHAIMWQVSAYIDIKARSPQGDSSLSASICKVSKQGEITMIHEHYLRQALDFGLLES